MFEHLGPPKRTVDHRSAGPVRLRPPQWRRPAPWRWGGVALLAGGLVASLLISAGDQSAAATGPLVRISELSNGGPDGGQDHFIEIANFGDAVADLDGWYIYGCDGRGRRRVTANPLVPALSGVSLAPGETYVIAEEDSTVAGLADGLYTTAMPNVGAGAWLEDDQRRLVDAVGIYAEPMDSECGDELPDRLDYGRGQTWQRVGVSGDVHADFIKAGRTPNAPNATEPDPGVQPSDVLISELANGGPDGSPDNFVELANYGDGPVDVGGWEIYRCTSTGVRADHTLQATVPAGTTLDPGEVFVAANTPVEVPDDVAHVHYEEGLSNSGFGILVADGSGRIMDSVGVYEPSWDSSCTVGTALPNRLDFGFGETYQRTQNTGDNTADFVKSGRSLGEFVAEPEPIPEPDPFEFGPVRISELTHSGPAGRIDNFYELANYGDQPVSLEGWSIHRCQPDGRRSIGPDIAAIGDVTLDPGETFLAVRRGSPLHDAGNFDASYGTNLSDDGFGLVVYDADGAVVDRVGVYGVPNPASNRSLALEGTDRQYSPCSKQLSMTNSADTDDGESIQRFQSTGTDATDFIPDERTPGELPDDLRGPADFTEEELAPVDVAPAPRPLPAAPVNPSNGDTGLGQQVDLAATAAHTTGEDVEMTFEGLERLSIVENASRAFTGVSAQAPPTRLRPEGEKRVAQDQIPTDPDTDPLVVEADEGFPYQRYELLVTDPRIEQLEVAWSGRSTGRNELQLRVWNHRTQAWELVDAAGGEITLVGTVDTATAARSRRVNVLVQDGPAAEDAFTDSQDEPNQEFKDPSEYDFSLGFMTDTQHLSEAHRRVYAEMNRWLVTNQDARDIRYTFHAGDLIQTWAVAPHSPKRADEEFQFASDVMRILEDAGHPHGVIPGNHDNMYGRANELYNEYFGPSRYEDQPWFGGSWRAEDNQNHYDVMDIDGTRFLMVYLGFFARDEAIDWANEVIADHPDHNVIVATHDYINPDGQLTSAETGRWTSNGEQYWDEVIMPNDNVFLVLAGHYHGVALNIKRDVGGVDGRMVVEMLADYQNYLVDGEAATGFLRLLQFDVDSKTMAVNTYSPELDEHNAHEYAEDRDYADADDEFTVDVDLNDTYDKRVHTDLIGLFTPAGELGTEEVAAGENATTTWSGLEPGTTYGWYTLTRDASGAVARSPLMLFTTAE